MSQQLLQEIARWKLEAKLEDNHRYFFHTSYVDRIQAGEHCYVIGRKGTGKTAISEYLTQQLHPTLFSVKLSFKNFPFNDLYSLSNDRYTPPNQYITLWKFLIYSSVAKLMLKNHNIDTAIRGKLESIYSDDPERSLSRSVVRWTSKNIGFGILGNSMQSGRTSTVSENDIPWIERVEILEQFIEANIDEATYLVVFDELDEDYKDMIVPGVKGHYEALLTSLFKAVQDVKAIFKDNRFHIRPIIVLREDIYDLIQDPDKTKWSDLAIHLDWDTESIKRLLAFRISRAIDPVGPQLQFPTAWKEIFVDTGVRVGHNKTKKLETFHFIRRGTVGRPRDYIKYLKECAEAATLVGAPKINAKIAVQVDKGFSNYLRSEFEDEIGGLLPEIGEILDLMGGLRKQFFTVAEFEKAYEEQVKQGLLFQRNPQYVLQVLFHFSVIGNQPRQQNVQFFKFNNAEARINLKESFCIHRGLFKSLQII